MDIRQGIEQLTLGNDISITERQSGGGTTGGDPPPSNLTESTEERMEVETDGSETLQGAGASGNSTSSMPGPSSSADGATGTNPNGAVVVVMIGLAGSGKTSVTQRLAAELIRKNSVPYIVNLDPACTDPPFPVNIDIRDTIDYKKIMQEYCLGPNGGIVTALNLFTTKFDQVIELIKERAKTHKYILIDTPGQIEVFLWSAAGMIILQSLGAILPTIQVYVTDVNSCINPASFISNMSYACSILLKTKLPLVLALNKSDLRDPTFAVTWIKDFEAFNKVTQETEGYVANLSFSLCLALEEFYNVVEYAPVSAKDGTGIPSLFEGIEKNVQEYERVYKVLYENSKKPKKATGAQNSSEVNRLKNDLKNVKHPWVFSTPAPYDTVRGVSLSMGRESDSETSSEDNSDDSDEEDEGVDNENKGLSVQEIIRRMTEERMKKGKQA